ncbi:hypothetical protein JCM10450v2_000530 [Rhodotorula kratochvilovae]
MSTPTLLASPLGPLHHQPPSSQGSAGRTLLSLLRRGRSTSKAPSLKTLKKRSPSYTTLDCTFERSTTSTYTPHAEPASPPPPYAQAVAAVGGAEEDLVVLKEHRVPAPSPYGELKVETPQDRKERLRRENMERKRAQLLAEDARIGEELQRLGF